jgi:hypothetical protein
MKETNNWGSLVEEMVDDAKIRLSVNVKKESSQKASDSSLSYKVKVMRKMLTQKTDNSAMIKPVRNVEVVESVGESSASELSNRGSE